MAILDNPIQCDHTGCGVIRGVANHWRAVMSCDNGGFLILPWEVAERDFDVKVFKHFCGPGHALNYVSAAIGDQGAPRP